MKKPTSLQLNGARENNLKDVDLTVEHDRFVAITGVSGSGKSSLAFDTIYAEGGRRYIETFSPYTRQFLDRLHKPEVTSVTGVRPALALEQRNRVVNSRSTVGTVTEINDYLKVVWSQLATVVCPTCQIAIENDTPTRVTELLQSHVQNKAFDYIAISFPVSRTGEASIESLIATLNAEGFIRFYNPNSMLVARIDDLSTADLTEKLKSEWEEGELYVIVDRVRVAASDNGGFTDDARRRLQSSISQAYKCGKGRCVALLFPKTKKERATSLTFSQDLTCRNCDTTIPKPRPSAFSFNSPLGACETCKGFGQVLELDRSLCVPNPDLSLDEGAIACWNTDSNRHLMRQLLRACDEHGIASDVPWRKLAKNKRELIFSATKRKDGFRGILEWFKRMERKKYKMHVRVFLSRYRSQFECPDCHGTRLKENATTYTVSDKTLPEIWQTPVAELHDFFEELIAEHTNEEVTETALKEVASRLRYLVEVGLGYLTLDRQSRTLSGGESQRVNLTSILGSRLVNTMLVLDEPSIGLHPRDTERLIEIIRALQTRGNTLFVVEHDADVIRASDEVIDLGPLAGSEGGEIVFQGTPKELVTYKQSLTGQYISQTEKQGWSHARSRGSANKSLEICGARANNLQKIDVEIPLERFVAITGVSGSGKSTLINECLHKAYQQIASAGSSGLKAIEENRRSQLDSLTGLEQIDDVILIDQSPVGKTPRSNPATYTKAWDIIRECFAATPQAEQLGLSKSAFSFNVDGGRCAECKGAGYHKIEMQFLADVFVECEACGGSRFSKQVLDIHFAGKNVEEFLNLTLRETVTTFEGLGEDAQAKEIRARLQPLLDLGLGYLKLGQPLSKLSGGEAQRVKLASYLRTPKQGKRKATSEPHYLFLLDEPTTGLHAHDVANLIETLQLFVDCGHSIVCIEHNLDLIAAADWLIDLGPEAGAMGGRVVATGDPARLVEKKALQKDSHTIAALSEQRTGKKKSTIKKKLPSLAVHEPAVEYGRRDEISIIGARHHNLKDISVSVPNDTLTVITGVSGSGKSSLAFDILFSEGQRRYIDCLSPYARQFITQLARPDVDLVDAIPPTIAVSQKTAPPLGIATIATTTELYQYMRLLFCKVGTQHCPTHDVPITNFSSELLAERILEDYRGERLFLFAPIIEGRKGYHTELFRRALRAEIEEARIDEKIVRLEEDLRLERHKLHWISLLVASLKATKNNKDLLQSAVEQCLLLGNGVLEIARGSKNAEAEIMSISRMCPVCNTGFRELDPQDFSFRSKRGLCTTCGGRGVVNKGKKDTAKLETCPTCDGARIGAIGRHVYIDGQKISDLTQLTAPQLLKRLKKIEFPKRLAPIVEPIMYELLHRLDIVTSVGLDYLELDRDSSTLSGGEAQRLRLARSLGSPLTGVCYVLDEPTIGLHPQDHGQLLDTLRSLRNAGNTVVVVEHDAETICAADHVIDIGPVGGTNGGRLVTRGSVSELIANEESLTGLALRERKKAKKVAVEKKRVADTESERLELIGATTNNLQDLTVHFPLNQLTVVAGVSGAGKSSLVHGTLVPAIFEAFKGNDTRKKRDQWTWSAIKNHEPLERFIEIDQTPIGRTPSSTPASYLGVLGEIRKVYAMLPEAKARGWKPSHFSFNTAGGRCNECSGRGFIKVPMSFLPDATTACERCDGMRYDDVTLEVTYQGLSIGELLQRTMEEAHALFANHKKIHRLLSYVLDLGLGYLTLGQSTDTLSGGEAQRLKIATELGSRAAVNTLYVLDEPTTGLHMVDVDKLLRVLEQLVAKGNTIVIIEHDLDVIRAADYLIELGPAAGARGGEIVFSGTPAELVKRRRKTPTRDFLTPARKMRSSSSGDQPHL